MLPGFYLPPGLMGGRITGPELTFLAATSDTANRNLYTFGSVNFGPAAPDRHIIAVVAHASGGSMYGLHGLTIGGSSATIRKSRNNSNGGMALYIASRQISSGTSGSIEVDLSGTTSGCAIAVYRVVGLANSSPNDNDDLQSLTGPMVLDVLSGGFCIAACVINDPSLTGININVDASRNMDAAYLHVGSSSILKPKAGLDVGFSGGSGNCAAAAITWR